MSGFTLKLKRPSNDIEEEQTDLIVKEHIIVLPKRANLKASAITQEFSAIDESDPLSSLFSQNYSKLLLKSKAETRPLLVCHDGRVLLEAFGPRSAQAQDFLTTIAEPISRPSHMHEYKLTAYSLYAAVAVGMETDTILNVLDQFSKASIPQEVISFIKDCTVSYGKVKLVLKRNSYFIESSFPDILRKLLKDETIAQAKLATKIDEKMIDPEEKKESDEGLGAVITLDHNDEEDATERMDLTQSFEIQQSMVEEVKKRCGELDFPLMEEYDFRNDDVNPNLDIDLSPKCIIRDYQEKSLSKMFGGGRGRARSGIIVLPTGAGKTLVGITAACTVKKSTLVLCTNAISVEQWANEFQRWSTIKESQIAKFTANSKAKFAGNAGIVISTYTMITHSGRRAWETTKMIEFLNSQEWGLLILDEVHVVPANVFRKVLTMVAAHTKLGLTATLVREDDKIQDLNFLIGPKLFEANWMDLANRGHIAKVEAVEVWCPMTAEYYKEYMNARPGKRRLLCVMNPYKMMACQYLIDKREAFGDKIIVFSDNVFALMHYARAFKKPFIYGGTSHEERQKIIQYFKQDHPSFRTIFLSKVGDMSLDLPEATCLIQISSQFGSRRQEAQRMGRILRAKRRHEEGFRSRFYTLLSKDTDEVFFSTKRKRFLVDQGYEFKVVTDIQQQIENTKDMSHYLCSSKKEQLELLKLVMQQSEEVGEDETVSADVDDIAGLFQQKRVRPSVPESDKPKPFQRLTAEQKQKRDQNKERHKKRNPLFKAWAK